MNVHSFRLGALALLACLPLTACRTASPCACDGPPAHTAEATVGTFVQARIEFQHADAALAANEARRDFMALGIRPSTVVVADRAARVWLVTATPAELARVKEVAARLDRPDASSAAPR